jgi:non-ribosomal peptide synthetase component F
MSPWPHLKYFRVVVNADGHHGLWPVTGGLPGGWRALGFTGDRVRCLTYAAEAWRDMRPRSVRGSLRDSVRGTAPVPGTLVELFADTVRRHRDAVAVSAGERRLTYAELDARSDDLAGLLGTLGIGAEDRIALHLGGGVDLVVALLGVVKAGAAYVPVDVRAPLPRRRAMISGSGARLVLTRPGWAARLTDLGCATLAWCSKTPGTVADAVAGPVVDPVAGAVVDAVAGPMTDPAERDRSLPGPGSAACVLYTSEPTGRLAGVVLEHRHLLALARDPVLPPLAPADRTAHVAVTSAGSVTVEVWRALADGAELVVLPTLPRPADLATELRRGGITAMLAPALAIDLVQRQETRAFSSLRVLCSVGPLPPETGRSIFRGGFSGRLFTLHGSAETTVAYAAHELTGAMDRGVDRAATLPIGRPLHGCDLHVLDEELRPVCPGDPGELYVGGNRVSRGYLDRPGLTVSRFLPDPFGSGGRIHATGARVRCGEGGVFEYLGRTGG